MKKISIPRYLPFWMALIMVVVSPRMLAQGEETSWTSTKGTTIWARLDGMDGNMVILYTRGRSYRVPMSNLAPKSIDKLGRMLKVPAGKIRDVKGSSQIAPVASTRSAAAAKTRESIPVRRVPSLPSVDNVVFMEPVQSEEKTSECLADIPPADGPDIIDVNGTLPEMASMPDPEHAGYGAVLPTRGSLSPSRIQESGSVVRLVGKTATAPSGAPEVIRTAIAAGNRLQTKYYKWGGGRAQIEDAGYDCSGSVSYVLIKAGLLRSVLHSSAFSRYGEAGPGRWITIYARNGHVFMTICGLRLDTGGSGGRGESGPRWRPHMRCKAGFVTRHPPGF